MLVFFIACVTAPLRPPCCLSVTARPFCLLNPTASPTSSAEPSADRRGAWRRSSLLALFSFTRTWRWRTVPRGTSSAKAHERKHDRQGEIDADVEDHWAGSSDLRSSRRDLTAAVALAVGARMIHRMSLSISAMSHRVCRGHPDASERECPFSWSVVQPARTMVSSTT